MGAGGDNPNQNNASSTNSRGDSIEQHFQDTTRDEVNRFVVQMPLKANVKPLGDTYLEAKRLFLSLEKRLQSDPQLKQGYCNFIHEFAELKHFEPVPIDGFGQEVRFT